MTPYVQDADFTLYCGDALKVLRQLPDASVDCAACSPPFYGLRDYGTGTWEGGDEGCDHIEREARDDATRIRRVDATSGRRPAAESYENSSAHPVRYRGVCGKCGACRVDQQIGLEESPELWAARLVDVFRELRRVLVKTGTLWIECGDSYASKGGGDIYSSFNERYHGKQFANDKQSATAESFPAAARMAPGLKPKDLIGAPFLLAFALRADGWWWRSTNIWHKPNCLPESATDRPTVAHSYVFQFAKSARYFHNAEAVREPAEWARWGDQTVVKEQPGKAGWIQPKAKAQLIDPASDGHRNLRSVWTIPTQGFPDAHFATWPEALVERIIKMACPEQVCRVCAVARELITETSYEKSPVHGAGSVVGRHEASEQNKRVTIAGLTECPCPRPKPDFPDFSMKYRPGIILDPFLGSGTTALVARRLGRACVGIELNESYAAMAAERLQQLSLLAEESA